MAERGAPIGNTNGSKGRPWAEALRAAMAEYADAKLGKADYRLTLRAIASGVVLKAADGDAGSVMEIANRMDGKPHQSSDMTLSGDLTIRPIDYSQTTKEPE